MKNLKTVAVIVVLAMNITQIIVSIDYYKNLFESFSSSVSYTSPYYAVQTILYLLIELMELSLVFVFLFGSGEVKDKAYRFLRFYFVIYFFFQLPVTWMFLVNYGGNSTPWQLFYIIAMRLVSVFCVVVFLVAKPERPVAKIDISDYELVSFTSTSHRFVHRLLDWLFIFPIMLSWVSMFERGIFSSQVVFYVCAILIYFLYYFVSESIFRQTFGKLCTNSCVVSNGINLSTGRIFLRTLSRYIPFDPLSFLWKGNWHDSVSSTSVVYVNTWEKVFDEGAQAVPTGQNPG